MNRKVFFVLQLALLSAADVRNFRVVFDNLIITHKLPSIIKFLEGEITERNNHTAVNCYLVLLQDVKKLDMSVTFDFTHNNKYNRKVFDYRFNGCAVLSAVHSNPIFSAFIRHFRNVMNRIPTCPLASNFNYTLNGYYLPEKDLPSYLPVGQFRNILKVFFDNIEKVKVTLKGRVIGVTK